MLFHSPQWQSLAPKFSHERYIIVVRRLKELTAAHCWRWDKRMTVNLSHIRPSLIRRFQFNANLFLDRFHRWVPRDAGYTQQHGKMSHYGSYPTSAHGLEKTRTTRKAIVWNENVSIYNYHRVPFWFSFFCLVDRWYGTLHVCMVQETVKENEFFFVFTVFIRAPSIDRVMLL